MSEGLAKIPERQNARPQSFFADKFLTSWTLKTGNGKLPDLVEYTIYAETANDFRFPYGSPLPPKARWPAFDD